MPNNDNDKRAKTEVVRDMGENCVLLADDGPAAWSSIDLAASRDDPYIRGLSQQRADYLVENWPFEHADISEATPDLSLSETEEIMSGTLSELQESLKTGKYDNNLDILERYEIENKDRDGAYERINRRRDV